MKVKLLKTNNIFFIHLTSIPFIFNALMTTGSHAPNCLETNSNHSHSRYQIHLAMFP